MLSSVGIEKKTKKFEVDGNIIKLIIFDTAGQERFRGVSLTLYKIADCCILVYDITKKDSFDTCKDYFIERIKEMCKSEIKVILLGNKSDLEEERQVSQEEGRKFAIENNFLFSEISCKKNSNIFESFKKLIEITYKDIANKHKDSLSLKRKDFNKKRKKCC